MTHTPEERCEDVLGFHYGAGEIEHNGRTAELRHDPERRLEAELHAHAIIRDAELLGVPLREHALHVFEWIDSIYEADEDVDGEDDVLLPMQEGAALVYLDRI